MKNLRPLKAQIIHLSIHLFYCENTGQIDENLWKDLSTGKLRLRFYARDKAGNVAYDEVIIKKVIYFVSTSDDDDKKKADDSIDNTQFVVTLIIITSSGFTVVIAGSTIYFLKKKKSLN